MTGCASDPGSIETLKGMDPSYSLGKFTHVIVTADKKSGISIPDSARNRIGYSIVGKLVQNPANHYKDAIYVQDNEVPPIFSKNGDTLLAQLTFTEYEKGSEIARFMLAGIGQIHIDSNVILKSATTGKTLAINEVTKTFAWGGIYGASTTIEDVEEGFAEAVVELLLRK